jgi:hypothetical protein
LFDGGAYQRLLLSSISCFAIAVHAARVFPAACRGVSDADFLREASKDSLSLRWLPPLFHWAFIFMVSLQSISTQIYQHFSQKDKFSFKRNGKLLG